MHKVMVGLEYKASVADKCVFTYIDANGHLIIVAIYMDDFLFISKFLKFVESSKSEISGHFKIKNLGLAKWILQMELMSRLLTMDLTFIFVSYFISLFLFFSFLFLFLEQLGLGVISHAVTSVTT